MTRGLLSADAKAALSSLKSGRYLSAAAISFAQTAFVGWGWSYMGDTFYPDANVIIGVVPSLAMVIMALNATSLAKPVLNRIGVPAEEDEKRWELFSLPRLTVYNITMLVGICGVIFWQQPSPPFEVVAILFVGLAYVNGYALARIPNFTVAYLANVAPENEQIAARALAKPTIIAAWPAVTIVAFLQATAGTSETNVEGFLKLGTFLSILIPLLYFPYFVVLSVGLMHLKHHEPSGAY